MASAASLKVMPSTRRIDVGLWLYRALATAGWCATTLLAAAGCLVVLFAMAGNGTLDGFFAQVERLAWHYLAADGARRAAFDNQALVVAALLLVATGYFRRALLISIFRTGGVDGPQRSNCD